MSNFYPAWPYFVSIAAMLGLVSTAPFAATARPAQLTEHRQSNLDGLRGFLAFGVFFAHAALYHQYIIDGSWGTVTVPRVYTLLAQGGVALFFMITGYLFWGKLLRDRGRPRWIALYLGRVFRIGPLYVVALGIMLLLVAIRSDFTLREPPSAVLREIAPWAALGWKGGGPDINGYGGTNLLLAGVTWTLKFEWRFYAALLVLSLAARTPRAAAVFVAAALASLLGYLLLRGGGGGDQPSRAICGLLFVCGMATASLEASKALVSLPRHALSCLVAILLATVGAGCSSAYTPLAALLLGASFYLIVSGADLFGLLSCSPAGRLGNVSFGIYLLQGLVFTVVFSSASVMSFARVSPVRHWLVVFGCAVLLMCIASLMHVLVELPGIELGRRLASRLGQSRVRTVHAPSKT